MKGKIKFYFLLVQLFIMSSFAIVDSQIVPSHPATLGPDKSSVVSNPTKMTSNEIEETAAGSFPSSELLRYPLIPERALEVLDFWFGYLPTADYYPSSKGSLWFDANPAIDLQLQNLFGEDVKKAAQGELNQWRETARGRLALILLLEQFPRRIYRNKSQAYTLDPMARGLVQEGLQKGDENKLYPIEQVFFYLPFAHAEDPYLQGLSVDLYRKLIGESPPNIRPKIIDFFRYALVNQEQIKKFGRFPHRNNVLQRKSTPEEKQFLDQSS